MRRAIIGILITAVLCPLILSGLVCRIAARSRIAATVTMLATFAACSGCAAILEHDQRSCHNQAMTVKAMTECNRQYPQQSGTITDRIAQPLGELERSIMHRNHDHE